MRLLAVTGLVALAVAARAGEGGAAAAARRTDDRGGAWRALEPGLDLGVFAGPSGDVAVVRIDTGRFELRLLNASAPGEGMLRTARGWAARAGAVAAINAAMYQEDYRTSVSLMRTRAHVNHPRVSKDKAVLAFDPLVRGAPPVKLIDRECENLDAVRAAYGTLVQSIRLVSCDRRNVWEPSPRKVSMAAIGVDGKGRVLFIHARAPSPVHELVNALLAMPIDLRQAMYVEGGPEAQLYVKGGGRELEWVGGFERAPGAENASAWPVPNVIVVVPKR